MGATSTDIGMNIKRARVAVGLTQEAAAEAAGLSRAAYRNLEAGTSEPRARTLLALSSALHVRPEQLLQLARALPRARFRSLKRLNDRTGLLIGIGQQLHDYESLEAVLESRASYRLAGIAEGIERGSDWPIRAAQAVRKELDLGDAALVRDIGGLLEDKAGVKVLRTEIHSDAFFGLSIGAGDGGPAVVVNTWDRISVERWIFTAAHELGHLVLHEEDFDPEVSVEEPSSEREANLFASHLLMPDATFQREWRQAAGLSLFRRVLKVKRIFHVSYRTVLYRLAEDRLVPDVWMRFQVEARRETGRTLTRTDEPDALESEASGWGDPEPSRAHEPGGLLAVDFAPDRRSRLVRQAIEEGRISVARGAEILGLPLVKMKTLQSSWA